MLMSTLIHQRVNACKSGENPKTICRIKSGWVVLGDVQFLPGYSLLLPDPVVGDLNQLNHNQRKVFLHEMSLIGDALLEVTDAYLINYEVLGNSEHALHAHIFPRYKSELDEFSSRPVWFYDWKSAPPFDADHDSEIMNDILQYLIKAEVAI